jgi:hypothetical protein
MLVQHTFAHMYKIERPKQCTGSYNLLSEFRFSFNITCCWSPVPVIQLLYWGPADLLPEALAGEGRAIAGKEDDPAAKEEGPEFAASGPESGQPGGQSAQRGHVQGEQEVGQAAARNRPLLLNGHHIKKIAPPPLPHINVEKKLSVL